MPTLPPSGNTDWLSSATRAQFEQLQGRHMPHRADIKRTIYTRTNGASVPSWPVSSNDIPCRVTPATGLGQQRIGEEPVDASRYFVTFMADADSAAILQGDRLDVVGRNSGGTSFALSLEVLSPDFGHSGVLVKCLCTVIRAPANQ